MDDQPLNEIMSQLDDIIWTDEEAVEAVSKEEFTRLVEEALIDVPRPQLLQIISRFAWCHRPEHVAPRWVPERSSIPNRTYGSFAIRGGVTMSRRALEVCTTLRWLPWITIRPESPRREGKVVHYGELLKCQTLKLKQKMRAWSR